MLKYAQIITCHTVTQSRRPGGYSFQMSGSSNHTKYLTLHQNMDAVINHTARNKSFNGCKFVPRICKVFKKKSEKRPTLKRSTSFSASTVFSRLPLLCRLLFQESRVLRRRTAGWEKHRFRRRLCIQLTLSAAAGVNSAALSSAIGSSYRFQVSLRKSFNRLLVMQETTAAISVPQPCFGAVAKQPEDYSILFLAGLECVSAPRVRSMNSATLSQLRMLRVVKITFTLQSLVRFFFYC